jgi:hypothetical protein
VERAEDNGSKVVQREFDDILWQFDPSEFEAEADSKALSSIPSNQIQAAKFQAGQPFDTTTSQFVEEEATDGVAARECDERDADPLEREQFRCGLNPEFFRSQQDGMELADRSALQALAGPGCLHGETDIDFLIPEEFFNLILTGFDKCEAKPTSFVVEASKKSWKVLPLNQFGRCNTQALVTAFCQKRAEFREPGKEGFNSRVESFTLTCQAKGATMKKSDTKTRLQLENLGANGWLLNAIGNVAGSGTYSVVFGHVVEEFKMMDVHGKKWVSKNP